MISSVLYAVYALAASAALLRGTATATAAGAGVAVYLLLRLVWSLRRRLGAAVGSAVSGAAVSAPAVSAPVALPAARPGGPGRP